jgi:hypothetical protein
MDTEIYQPNKICPKCGEIIPLNGYQYDLLGKPILDEEKKHVWNDKAELLCKKCAIAEKAPEKRVRYNPRNDEQIEIEAPTMYVR